jgi:hypothetical protein
VVADLSGLGDGASVLSYDSGGSTYIFITFRRGPYVVRVVTLFLQGFVTHSEMVNQAAALARIIDRHIMALGWATGGAQYPFRAGNVVMTALGRCDIPVDGDDGRRHVRRHHYDGAGQRQHHADEAEGVPRHKFWQPVVTGFVAQVAHLVPYGTLCGDQSPGEHLAKWHGMALFALRFGARGTWMIQSTSDFEDATAFERYALDSASNLVPAVGTASVDLRGTSRTFASGFNDDLTLGGRQQLLADLRPLLFGAAWKVLDLLVELALRGAGEQPDRQHGTEWTIERKKALAFQHSGVCPPLSSEATLWKALCDLYVSTLETRHSLVHRWIRVDPGSGDITGTDRNGASFPTFTAEHQEAFIQVARAAAASVISGSLSPRQRDTLLWQLARLQGHHGHQALGGVEPGLVPRLIADVQRQGTDWIMDVPSLLQQARAAFSQAEQFDVELHVPDGSDIVYEGELETAPQRPQVIDPASPPPWLKRQQ